MTSTTYVPGNAYLAPLNASRSASKSLIVTVNWVLFATPSADVNENGPSAEVTFSQSSSGGCNAPLSSIIWTGVTSRTTSSSLVPSFANVKSQETSVPVEGSRVSLRATSTSSLSDGTEPSCIWGVIRTPIAVMFKSISATLLLVPSTSSFISVTLFVGSNVKRMVWIPVDVNCFWNENESEAPPARGSRVPLHRTTLSVMSSTRTS